LRGLEREKNRRHGQSLKSLQSLGRIIGKPGLGSGSRFEARALASPRRLWPWAVYSKTSIGLARAATQLPCLIAVEQRPHRFDMRLISRVMGNGLAFSVLDLVGMRAGEPAGSAIARSVNLAQHVEQLGYKRYWLAEHHSIPGLACSATPVLIGHVAAATKTIRVGSGRVMLPNHAPLVVAEQFGTREALYPGRFDLGLGRAPGSDFQTMRALRRDLQQGGQDFPALLAELQTYLGPERPQGSGESDSRAGKQCADHLARVERLQRATSRDAGLAICVCGPLATSSGQAKYCGSRT
jgi:hypothetical protein